MMNNELDKNELSLENAIENAKKIISQKTGIVKTLILHPFFNDEPKFFHYAAELCDTSLFSDTKNYDRLTGGLSLDRKKAMIKCLGEAIERYCLTIYKESNFIFKSYNMVKQTALNPNKIVNFSKSQFEQENFQVFKFTEKSKFKWIKGFSLTKNKSILVPAQLIFVPYHYRDEPIIRLPITTGAASGTSLSAAIYRGICEVVERDAFIITYLNKLPRTLIDISDTKNKIIQRLKENFERYNLEWHIYDIKTDIDIPTVMSVLIDRSDVGPAVSIGAKAGLNLEETIIGSVEEAQQLRPWMREELMKVNKSEIKQIEKNSHNIYKINERGLFWSQKNKIKYLKFLLNNRKVESLNEIRKSLPFHNIDNLKTLLNIFKSKNMEIIFVDVTTCDIAKIGFRVVKVIIPKMQPLYLDERYKYLGGERLYKIPNYLDYKNKETKENELNKIPHPFL